MTLSKQPDPLCFHSAVQSDNPHWRLAQSGLWIIPNRRTEWTSQPFHCHLTCGLETWECISCECIADVVCIRSCHYANVDVCIHKHVRRVKLSSAPPSSTHTHLFEAPALLTLPFSLFSICHETLLNLKSGCLCCSFWTNLFSIFQFRWSATLTMLQGIWDGLGAWRSRGRGGRTLWDGPDGLVGRPELLSSTTTRSHTEARSDPATREGTGVLQPAWAGINEPRCFPQNAERPGWGKEGGGVGGRDRKEEAYLLFFFLLCPSLRPLSVRFLRFLITTDHGGLCARSIVGNYQRGICLWRRTRAAANL